MADNSTDLNVKITAEDLASAVIKGINEGFSQVDASLKKISVTAPTVKKSIDDTHGSFAGLNSLLGPLGALLGGISFAEIARSALEASIKMQSLDVMFKTITGSTEAAKVQIQFIREESARLGLNMVETADAFAKFAAGAKGTSLEGEGAKKVFVGVTEAVTALHLPADSAQRILYQLSQMMSKGKVNAQDLRVVAESLPGTYTAVAQSLGLTTAEMTKQMEAGTLLTTDVFPKLAAHLHSTFGPAAVEGAKSIQASINRFKNEIIDTSAKIGEALLPAIHFLMDGFSGVMLTVKAAISAMGPAAPVVLAFSAAIAGLALANVALSTAAGEATVAMLTNPVLALAAAGIAAIAGIAMGLNAIAEAFGVVDKAASSDAVAKRMAAQEAAFAKEKKILEDYEAALGISLDRQTEKREKQYQKDLLAVSAKYEQEIIKAEGNQAKILEIQGRESADRIKVANKYYQDVDKLREDDRKKDEDAARRGQDLAEKYYKVIGDTTMAGFLAKRKIIEDEKNAINSYYDYEATKAKDNVVALIAIDQARSNDLKALAARHANDPQLTGLELENKKIEILKQSTAEQINEIKNRIALGVVSEIAGRAEILQIQEDLSKKRLDIATRTFNLIALTYPEDSDKFRAAEKAKEEAAKESMKVRLDYALQDLKDRKDAYELTEAAYKTQLTSELNDLHESLINRRISEKVANNRSLLDEKDYWDKMVALRTARLAELDPQTQAKEYGKVLDQKLEAERQYIDKSFALKELQKKQIEDVTKKHNEELAARDAADKQSLENSRAFASSLAALWDNAYNNAISSLQKLSDAAYNAFAGMHNLPQKTVGNIDSLRESAIKAGTEFGRLYNVANQVAMSVNAGWSDAWRRLAMIPAEAARITAEFLNQKVAAADLAQALTLPAHATEQFVTMAKQALGGMKLLDASTLDKLKGQIDTIKAAMVTFTEKIIGALKSLQDEWDNMSMSKLQLEEKRYNDQRLQWQKDLTLAQQQQNNDAIKALNDQLALMEKIHAAKVKDLRSNPSNLAVPGMATGGNVGGSGTGDNQLRWLDPREWVMRPEATSFWGGGVMAAMNSPWTDAGQSLAARVAGLVIPSASVSMPKLAMASGGPVGELQGSKAGGSFSVNIYPQRLDEATVRREVLPVLEKFARLTK